MSICRRICKIELKCGEGSNNLLGGEFREEMNIFQGKIGYSRLVPIIGPWREHFAKRTLFSESLIQKDRFGLISEWWQSLRLVTNADEVLLWVRCALTGAFSRAELIPKSRAKVWRVWVCGIKSMLLSRWTKGACLSVWGILRVSQIQLIPLQIQMRKNRNLWHRLTWSRRINCHWKTFDEDFFIVLSTLLSSS